MIKGSIIFYLHVLGYIVIMSRQIISDAANGTSKALKISNVEPLSSLIRKLSPLAAFFIAFTTVMTVLIIYMDNTGMLCNFKIATIFCFHRVLSHGAFCPYIFGSKGSLILYNRSNLIQPSSGVKNTQNAMKWSALTLKSGAKHQ